MMLMQLLKAQGLISALEMLFHFFLAATYALSYYDK